MTKIPFALFLTASLLASHLRAEGEQDIQTIRLLCPGTVDMFGEISFEMEAQIHLYSYSWKEQKSAYVGIGILADDFSEISVDDLNYHFDFRNDKGHTFGTLNRRSLEISLIHEPNSVDGFIIFSGHCAKYSEPEI